MSLDDAAPWWPEDGGADGADGVLPLDDGPDWSPEAVAGVIDGVPPFDGDDAACDSEGAAPVPRKGGPD